MRVYSHCWWSFRWLISEFGNLTSSFWNFESIFEAQIAPIFSIQYCFCKFGKSTYVAQDKIHQRETFPSISQPHRWCTLKNSTSLEQTHLQIMLKLGFWLNTLDRLNIFRMHPYKSCRSQILAQIMSIWWSFSQVSPLIQKRIFLMSSMRSQDSHGCLS